MKRAWLTLFVIAIAFSLGTLTLKGFGKEQKSSKEADINIVSEKINEVLNNQQDIIARLKDIRKELDIIRIRASHR